MGINGYELKNPEVRREKERRNIMDQRKNTENGFNENGFNTVEEALEDLRQGKLILVTDDPDRENEGDFICAAEFATTENINFMAVHGKGLMYANVRSLCGKIAASSDGHKEYR